MNTKITVNILSTEKPGFKLDDTHLKGEVFSKIRLKPKTKRQKTGEK